MFCKLCICEKLHSRHAFVIKTLYSFCPSLSVLEMFAFYLLLINWLQLLFDLPFCLNLNATHTVCLGPLVSLLNSNDT